MMAAHTASDDAATFYHAELSDESRFISTGDGVAVCGAEYMYYSLYRSSDMRVSDVTSQLLSSAVVILEDDVWAAMAFCDEASEEVTAAAADVHEVASTDDKDVSSAVDTKPRGGYWAARGMAGTVVEVS